MGCVPPIVKNHIWLPRLSGNSSLNAPPEVNSRRSLLVYKTITRSLPRSPPSRQRLVLQPQQEQQPPRSESSICCMQPSAPANKFNQGVGVMITSYLCAQAAQRLHKDCSLSIDMGASHYPCLLQWLVFLCLVPENCV